MTDYTFPISIQRLVCTGCGAEANASCNCGLAYVPASQRAAEAIKANPEKSNRAIAEEIGVGRATVNRARNADAEAGGSREPPDVEDAKDVDSGGSDEPPDADAPAPAPDDEKPATATGWDDLKGMLLGEDGKLHRPPKGKVLGKDGKFYPAKPKSKVKTPTLKEAKALKKEVKDLKEEIEGLKIDVADLERENKQLRSRTAFDAKARPNEIALLLFEQLGAERADLVCSAVIDLISQNMPKWRS